MCLRYHSRPRSATFAGGSCLFVLKSASRIGSIGRSNRFSAEGVQKSIQEFKVDEDDDDDADDDDDDNDDDDVLFFAPTVPS